MAHYHMAELASQIGLERSLFLTREKGQQAYEILRERIIQVPEHQPLVLNFPPDQVIDASFADESVIRLGESLAADEFGQRCIIFQRLTDDSIENVEAVLSLRRLNLVFLSAASAGSWRCIGQLQPSLRETLQIVADRGQLTASELAELLNLAINTASNRLRRLFRKRLVSREHEVSERGLQYIYYFWEWE